jgi:hypothetical protein
MKEYIGTAFMMKPILHIQAESLTGTEQCTLLLIAGETHFSYGLLHKAAAQNELLAFGYYEKEPHEDNGREEAEDYLEKIPWPAEICTHACVALDVTESMPVPMEFYKEETIPLQLNAVYGPQAGTRWLSEPLPQLNMVQVCRLSSSFYDVLQRRFGKTIYRNMQAVLLTQCPAHQDAVMQVYFRGKELRVMVFRDHALQLMQGYEYNTPADVLYYLLRICQQLQLHQAEVKIILSGFVEKDSAIYRELYKFFINLEFDILPAEIKLAAALQQYPEHYYSFISKLALCEL